jgi:putative transposase
VDRDAAAVLNMLWKITPEGAAEVVSREAVGRANPIIPRLIIYAVWVSLKALNAGDKRPAALVWAAPVTPARGGGVMNRLSGLGGG